MTLDDLRRCEAELELLVAREGATPYARADAKAFNEDADALRVALVAPARALLEKGREIADLGACVERAVAQLAFWRRVLSSLHGATLEPARTSEFLLRYLLR